MSGRGGARKGAGRPLATGEFRKPRMLRADTEEWRLIHEFSRILKYGDKDACRKFVEEHALKETD